MRYLIFQLKVIALGNVIVTYVYFYRLHRVLNFN